MSHRFFFWKLDSFGISGPKSKLRTTIARSLFPRIPVLLLSFPSDLHSNMSSINVLRASVIQACTHAYSLPETLEKMERLTSEAKDSGARLAVFPEALYVDESELRKKVYSF
ncbi:hypothetical protein E1B28_001029 [Marasmius oreades]|uniref:CN hydrolase domain-containing protein n=1 Tax=Marasmius oreades TaxID=181124 RepID=A0A9P7V2K7_9AGAR|nr:uncharacterized protein E1B28_001029 [Marasmius oreades]KAG7099158.1 hypothetical protein E1B28_001029 [Marasmius oreades]